MTTSFFRILKLFSGLTYFRNVFFLFSICLILNSVYVIMKNIQGGVSMDQTANNTNVSQKNYGIDLLRLVAAFYVIILHTLNQGGVYDSTSPYSYQHLLCMILLIVSYCAVNIFGIISGYVGYREPLKKTSYARYLPLWLTVVLYGVLFAGIYMVLLPGTVTVKDVIKAVLPVTGNLYWYFSAFTLVFLFAPFLNRILYYSSEKELKWLFLLICCIITTIEFLRSSFAMHRGYSAHWLVLLYLVGGIMKKTGIGSRLSASAAIIWIILLDLGYFFLGLKWPELSLLGFTVNLNFNLSYITPFYLATAILHVILFSRFRFPKFLQKAIAFAAPAAFSVYIVNTNPLFWTHFMKNRFVAWADNSPAGIFVCTITFSLGFVVIVVILDFFRQRLFRLLGVQNWVQKLSVFFHKDKAI